MAGHRTLIFPALAALAACSGGPVPEKEERPNQTQQQLSQTIAPIFHGAWDYEGGTCDPASASRLEIGPKQIVFPESVWSVTAVQLAGPATNVVSLSFEEAGVTSTSQLTLSIENWETYGELLMIAPFEDGEPPFEFFEYELTLRKRCPA